MARDGRQTVLAQAQSLSEKRSRSGCQPPHHQVDHGNPDPRLGRLWQGFEVFAEPPRAMKPAKRALDDPALLQAPKALVRWGRFTITRVRCSTVATHATGPGHMTVDTYGKPDLPTLHIAFKAQRMSAEVPRSSKESWCPNMAICLE